MVTFVLSKYRSKILYQICRYDNDLLTCIICNALANDLLVMTTKLNVNRQISYDRHADFIILTNHMT
jgi:hypothetical protein